MEDQNKPGKSFVDSSEGKLAKAPTGKDLNKEEEEESDSREESK